MDNAELLARHTDAEDYLDNHFEDEEIEAFESEALELLDTGQHPVQRQDIVTAVEWTDPHVINYRSKNGSFEILLESSGEARQFFCEAWNYKIQAIDELYTELKDELPDDVLSQVNYRMMTSTEFVAEIPVQFCDSGEVVDLAVIDTDEFTAYVSPTNIEYVLSGEGDPVYDVREDAE